MVSCMLSNRGGVLEPEGTVEIKFKWKDQERAMSRLDPIITTQKQIIEDPNATDQQKKEAKRKLAERYDKLKLVYHQVSGQGIGFLFADNLEISLVNFYIT